jgi:CHAT domain-containing protein
MVVVAPPDQLINEPSFPGTAEEVERIVQVGAGISINNLIGPDATVEKVLSAMEEAHWAHFACSSSMDHGNAMNSSLLLHGRELKLSDIVKESFPHADFAFLSTGETGIGDTTIPEESVHWAAGMLLTGYRGVIASGYPWMLEDSETTQAVENIYKRMFRDGKPNRKEAARALHEVTKGMKESGVGFQIWVPFIHVGR